MKSIKLKSNFGKIYIEKLPSYLLWAIIGAIFARLVFVFVSYIFKTVPFICYDDMYIYNTIEDMTTAQIINRLTFRNIYPMISMYLNPYHIGEYISAARLLNTILFIFLVVKVDDIARMTEISIKTRKLLAFVFAFSPVFVIHSMVQLREVLCAFLAIYVFWAFLRYEKKEKFSWVKTLIAIVLLYYTRTYVLEALMAILVLYKVKDGKWYVKGAVCVAAALVAWYFVTNSDYMYVLNGKIEFYVEAETQGSGILSRIQVTGLHNLYNLFVLVPFVQLSPLPSVYQKEFYDANSWAALLTYASGVAAFFLPYFWINVLKVLFTKKSQVYLKLFLLFYLGFAFLIAVVEPHNARFMFFITPIFYFFGVDGFVKLKEQNPKNIIFGFVCMFVPYVYLLL